VPSVINWTRLEPYSRSIGLEGGLYAEVRDPLWMLARQWQLGEFWGEDAGTPVQVRLRMDCTPLTRYLPGGIPASWYAANATTVAQGQRIGRELPLEVAVEREPVRNEERFQPRLAAEAGVHFLRVLTHFGAGAQRSAATSTVPLEMPAGSATQDAETRRFLSVVARRVPDGAVLASVLRVIKTPAALNMLGLAYRTIVSARVTAWQNWLATLPSATRDTVNAAAGTWLTWYDDLFRAPGGAAGDSSWIPDRLEYEFAVSAPTPQQEVLLTAPEYTDGRLDWYSFDALAIGSLGALQADLTGQNDLGPRRWTVLPTPVRYPGMPSARYWEFEDARIDFGAIATGTQQLAHLLLIQFALVSGDDWFIIPIDMPVGSVSTVRWLVVTDTFGERTLIPSARAVDRVAGSGRLAWDMFRLSPDLRPVWGMPRGVPDAFLLAPALGTSLHGVTLEDVALLRDELANMAWAVERVVESPLGRPADRAQAFHTAQSQPAAAPAAGGRFRVPSRQRRAAALAAALPDASAARRPAHRAVTWRRAAGAHSRAAARPGRQPAPDQGGRSAPCRRARDTRVPVRTMD
jgi:hypothetical protein